MTIFCVQPNRRNACTEKVSLKTDEGNGAWSMVDGYAVVILYMCMSDTSLCEIPHSKMQTDELEVPFLDAPSEKEEMDSGCASFFTRGCKSPCMSILDTSSEEEHYGDGCTSLFVDGFQSTYLSCVFFQIFPAKQETQQQEVQRIQQKQVQQRKMVEALRQRLDEIEERRVLRQAS